MRHFTTIRCVEGTPFDAPPALANRIRVSGARLKRTLRPRLGGLREEDGQFVIKGIAGVIDLGAGAILEVDPKVEVGDDWIASVLRLLVGSDRVDAGGERAAGFSNARRNLLDVLATQFAARVERAYRRDGPILLMTRRQAVLRSIKGKLQVGAWARRASWQPHRFPVAYNQLTADNEISGALAAVCTILRNVSTSHQTRASLTALRSALLNGGPGKRPIWSTGLPPLPAQWAVYEPAWSITRAIAAQRSLLGPKGTLHGISLAIETWPMLERLLTQCLKSAARLGLASGRNLDAPSKFEATLLQPLHGPLATTRGVEPDGRLVEAGHTIAVFEAKYKRRSEEKEWPPREDIFQAVTTAAACSAPLAVLIYPETFPTTSWVVLQHNNAPIRLAAVGLGLFRCVSDADVETRAAELLSLLPPAAK